MDAEATSGVFVLILLSVTALLVGGCQFGRTMERNYAIEAGVGGWRCNPKTGIVEFIYFKQK